MPMLPLAFATLLVGSALAQTSLYIPGFDPQPISADILGVDAQGRTTWALHKGAPTDTFDDSGFVGTATLVEGPNDVSFTYAASKFTIGLGCSLSGDLAICSTGIGAAAVTETDTVSRILVQAGTTAPLATPTPGTTPGPSSPNASSPSQSESGPSQTTQNDPTSKPTSRAKALTPYLATLSLSIVMVAVLI